MLYFLDSADTAKIASALKQYPLAGVTTNPTILARDLPAEASLADVLFEIRRLTEGKKLFVQVTSKDADGMVRDAETIAKKLGGDLSIKVPATKEGLEAIKKLHTLGIGTTATAVYSTSQAMLAAAAGADFTAPYLSHLDNLSLDGPAVAGEIARQFTLHGMKTQVLAASFRTAAQIERCLALGVSAVTVTAEMLDILAAHPGTEKELASFEANWQKRFPAGIAELL